MRLFIAVLAEGSNFKSTILCDCRCSFSINLGCLKFISLLSARDLSTISLNPNRYWSKACSITKNYSSIHGQEGILVNINFVVNSLVILSKLNQMRIWLCLRLITNRGGQQTVHIAIDHVRRQVHIVNRHSKMEKLPLFFMTACCRKKEQCFFLIRESCSSGLPLRQMYNIPFWEYLIRCAALQTHLLKVSAKV